MEAIGHALGSLWLFILPFSVIAWFFYALLLPFLVVSGLRNVAKTRRALERIADALDSGQRPGGGGVLGI